jgi:hypothetical protein
VKINENLTFLYVLNPPNEMYFFFSLEKIFRAADMAYCPGSQILLVTGER